MVLTLLAHGCPPQAIVAAFGLDERTVADWQARAGRHAQAVHDHLVEAGQVDLQYVRASMYLVACAYNFCWVHASLRQSTAAGAVPYWQERTPAMAAGLTDHPWTMSELLHY